VISASFADETAQAEMTADAAAAAPVTRKSGHSVDVDIRS
jgi:hypothetical protein